MLQKDKKAACSKEEEAIKTRGYESFSSLEYNAQR